MYGTIVYFKQLFVFETIDNAEQSFLRSNWDKRTSAILGRKAFCKRGCYGMPRLCLKSKNASKKESKTEERASHRWKPGDFTLIIPTKKFSKGDAATVRRQVHRPDVV